MDFDSARVDSYSVARRLLDAESGSEVRPEVVKHYPTRGRSVVMADGFPDQHAAHRYLLSRTGGEELAHGQPGDDPQEVLDLPPRRFAGGQADRPRSAVRLPTPAAAVGLASVEPDSAVLWMRYVMTRDESNQVQRLNPEGKRQFCHHLLERTRRRRTRRVRPLFRAGCTKPTAATPFSSVRAGRRIGAGSTFFTASRTASSQNYAWQVVR